MQRPATLAEKISGVFLIALGICALYIAIMAITEGHLTGSRSSRGHPIYFSESPIYYLLKSGFWLVSGIVFPMLGWAVIKGKHHTQTVKPRALPSWFKIGAQVHHPTYGSGAIIQINGRKHVTVVFEHHSEKTLAIEVALTLLKPASS